MDPRSKSVSKKERTKLRPIVLKSEIVHHQDQEIIFSQQSYRFYTGKVVKDYRRGSFEHFVKQHRHVFQKGGRKNYPDIVSDNK